MRISQKVQRFYKYGEKEFERRKFPRPFQEFCKEMRCSIYTADKLNRMRSNLLDSKERLRPSRPGKFSAITL